jgi:ParB/RepB/Spo0J family partition protein
MAKKRIQGTKALFEETEAVAEALAQQPEHAARDIPIAQIVPSRYNPRQTYSRDALGELAKSIQEHGFMGALDGRELPDGRIELAYGSRRLLAARHAGLRSLPVALHAWTDAQMCFTSLAENLARERLSEVDEAMMVRRLCEELKLTDKEIADVLGKPAGWVESCLIVGDPAPAPEEDPDAAKLDEVVASLIGDSIPSDLSSPIFGLDVSRDATLGPLRHPEPAVRRPRASAPPPEPSRGWVETGSTMLVLASDALQAFDPGAVSDDEIEAALGWLVRLEEQSALFRAELESRR